DLRLRFRALRSRHKFGVLNFLLQDPFAWILQRRQLVARGFHINTQAGEGVERLQHKITGSFGRRKFIRKKCRGRVGALKEWQGMFTDPKIPVRMTNPKDVELFLKAEWQLQIRSPQ